MKAMTFVKMHRSWFVVGAIVLVLALLYWFDPRTTPFAPRCLWHDLTGWQCPTCGLQRALHAVLHGRLKEALLYNPFLVYSLPYFALVVMTACMPEGKWQKRLHNTFESRRAIILYIVLFVLWGFVRNIFGI